MRRSWRVTKLLTVSVQAFSLTGLTVMRVTRMFLSVPVSCWNALTRLSIFSASALVSA